VGIFETVTCGYRQAYVPEGVYVDVRILQSSGFLVTSRDIVLLSPAAGPLVVFSILTCFSMVWSPLPLIGFNLHLEGYQITMA